MRNILLLSAGRRVSLLRAFQDAAKLTGDTKVFAADLNPSRSAACNVADEAFQLPHVLSENYPDALEDICRKNDIAMVIPCIDTELLTISNLRKKFSDFNCNIIVCDELFISACRDKRKSFSFFKEKGLESPNIYDRNSIEYPAFSKPYDGSLSSNVAIIRNKDEITPKIKLNEKIIFTEYLDHNDHEEFTCDVYINKTGGVSCVVPRLRIEVRGGEVAKALTVRNEIVDYLWTAFSPSPDARGCLTVQIMRNKETKRKWLIEVNPRFGGGYPLTQHSGARYPDWLVKEYLLNEKIEEFSKWEENLMMLRYDAEVIVRDKKYIL